MFEPNLNEHLCVEIQLDANFSFFEANISDDNLSGINKYSEANNLMS